MYCLIVLCRQVLSPENDNIQGIQVSTVAKGFPDDSFDPVSLNSVLQVALRKNQTKSGPPKVVGGRQDQEMPVGNAQLYVVKNAGIISRSQ